MGRRGVEGQHSVEWEWIGPNESAPPFGYPYPGRVICHPVRIETPGTLFDFRIQCMTGTPGAPVVYSDRRSY